VFLGHEELGHEELAHEPGHDPWDRPDLDAYRPMAALLMSKAARLIFNRFQEAVEVCASMQQGGLYPATSDPRSTSLGTAAIEHFCRPVRSQDSSPEFFSAELRALSQ